MPLYEYECDSCHHRFEVIQRFSDPPIAICPKCGAQVQKLPSAPAIQFKGAGWYVTDYAKKSDSDSAKRSADSGKSSSDKESSSSDKPSGGDKAPKTSTTASDSKSTTEKRSPSTESPSASSTGSSSGSSDKQS